jgi:lysophospholipase L1-like esterase
VSWSLAVLRALYLAVVALAIAGLLEWVARALNPFGYVRSASHELVYELRPDWRGEHNADGQRDRRHPRAKPAGTFRVVGLGDSYSYGMGVPAAKTFLAVAEELLSARSPAPVDVINFGVPGYNTGMEAALLERVARDWEPDLAVVQFCRNDFNLPNFVWTRRNGLVAHSYALHQLLWPLAERWPGFWKAGVMGYRYERNVFPVPGLEAVPMRNSNPIGDPALAPEALRPMLGHAGVRAALDRIAALSRARGLPVVWLVGWGGFDQDVAAWGAQRGLEALDVWPGVTAHLAAQGRPFESIWVAPPTDNHPNVEGHAVIGALLARVLEAHLPPGPP